MKRSALFAAVALVLLPAMAQAGSIGIGGYGGMSIPIVQDDNGNGPVFGARAPVALNKLLTVEPYFASTSAGDAELEIGGINYTRDGLDATGFGANVMLTFGDRVKFYPFGGYGSSTLTRDGSADVTMTGFNYGIGLGISPIEKLTIHLRGEGNTYSKDDAGRTFGIVTVGVSYDLFPILQ